MREPVDDTELIDPVTDQGLHVKQSATIIKTHHYYKQMELILL